MSWLETTVVTRVGDPTPNPPPRALLFPFLPAFAQNSCLCYTLIDSDRLDPPTLSPESEEPRRPPLLVEFGGLRSPPSRPSRLPHLHILPTRVSEYSPT